MKNNKLDWKGVGQFVAVLVQAWTVIKKVMVETKTGVEFIEWFAKDERKLVTTWLQLIVAQYKKSIILESNNEHVIDFDSAPAFPASLTIAPDNDQIKTRVRGKRNLSEIRVGLHLDDGQTNGKWVKGYNLKPRLEGQPVLGSQLLDFYLEHPDLIPKDCKTKGLIFFWGTIYRDIYNNLYVYYLRWYRTRWVKDYHCLGGYWGNRGSAAVSASYQV